MRPGLKEWIAVDLDGTLAVSHGFVSITHSGEPVHLMVDRVKRWLAEEKDVRIFTARVSPASRAPGEMVATIDAIERWCLKHIGVVLPITCTKDGGLTELWDDRAIQVIRNTGERVDDLI